MKHSNLAQCLEEYEAIKDSLRLSSEPITRQVVAREAPIAATSKPRRRRRTGGIETRDQGLRPFRVL